MINTLPSIEPLEQRKLLSRATLAGAISEVVPQGGVIAAPNVATAFLANATAITARKGNSLTISLKGSGQQLGNFTGTLRVTTHGSSSAGDGVLRVASGDELYFRTETTFDPSLPGQRGTFSITGGTGRFDGARGGGQFTAGLQSLEPVEVLAVHFAGTWWT